MTWVQTNLNLYHGEHNYLSGSIYRDQKCWRWRMGPSRMIYEKGTVYDQERPKAVSLKEAKRKVELACIKYDR